MAPTLKPSITSSLHAYIDSATSSPTSALPGAIVQIVDAQGHALSTHATHTHTPETLFSIHSCSKLIGDLALLQHVDRGLASLNSPTLISTHRAELWVKKVLVSSTTTSDGTPSPVFEDRKGAITARMLMTHTAGTGMSFNSQLRDYLGSASTGFDWLSVLIERITEKALEDVLREGIFEPLGIEIGGFRGEWGGRGVGGPEVDFWPASLRLADGSFMRIPGFAEEKVEREDAWPRGSTHVQSIATGLVLSVSDLAKIYSVLLPQNLGVEPVTGVRIVSAEAAAEVARVVHEEEIRHDCRDIPSASPFFLPCEMQAEHVDPVGCFTLGAVIQGEDRVLRDGRRGKSKGSIYWLGASNATYWVDDEKGIVVVVVANFFPFSDAKWVDFVAGLEGLLYEGLE
ncbi:beta-lactamase/transpeptidase-like protein [Bimuria novae-zelandiae CBS 107.79]|uniref:Beta-lactamase/transpeptidase-like protein n=1 Tax=Bimuria novae-zelandiae CBS 107.79 TaxID=1447943 RepID=A0A6A5VGC1_9PLEO|nr:beta-lactamase/transpeptidase-like protein [Bimuria novae-zelandiae CBS 107.79]